MERPRIGLLATGQRQEQREEDQWQHRTVCGGSDGVGRDQRRQPRREGLRLTARRELCGRLHGPSRERRPAGHPLRQQREQGRCQGDHHGGDRRQQEAKDDQRPPAKATDRRDVRCRCDSGDEQRNDQRDHRHPDRVHPECASIRAMWSTAPISSAGSPTRQPTRRRRSRRRVRRERVCFLSSGRSHYIIRSPPLMSNAAPVMYPAASDAAKQMRSATSRAVPRRGTG